MAIAIIQARMTSRRLPGKVLLPLGNETALAFMVNRVRQATFVESIWVATSTEASDDPIVRESKALGVSVFRGSMDDVLSRYSGIASNVQPRNGLWIRLTADCPLISPELVDLTVHAIRGSAADYVSNSIEPSFPRGLDVEVFTSSALDAANTHASSPYDREHVTTWMIRNLSRPDTYPRLDPSRHHLRVTVDHPEDYQVVRAIHREITARNGKFGTEEIIDFLEAHPEIANLNQFHNGTQISDRLQS